MTLCEQNDHTTFSGWCVHHFAAPASFLSDENRAMPPALVPCVDRSCRRVRPAGGEDEQQNTAGLWPMGHDRHDAA
jgi:hypothetical protein